MRRGAATSHKAVAPIPRCLQRGQLHSSGKSLFYNLLFIGETQTINNKNPPHFQRKVFAILQSFANYLFFFIVFFAFALGFFEAIIFTSLRVF